MPAIFSAQDRAQLRTRMLDTGWDMLLAHGYRGLRIEDIARDAGMAKGTFYNFFSSKEEFVRQMVAQNRAMLLESFQELCADGEGVGPAELSRWLRAMWHSRRVIYRCIDVEDCRRLARATGEGLSMGSMGGEDLMRLIARHARSPRAEARIEAAAGMQQAIAAALLMRDAFEPAALEAAVDALIDATVDELFGPPQDGGPARGRAGAPEKEPADIPMPGAAAHDATRRNDDAGNDGERENIETMNGTAAEHEEAGYAHE